MQQPISPFSCSYNPQLPELLHPATIEFPWTSEDQSYKIIYKHHTIIASVLDISQSKTPKAMAILEQHFGKGATTRNWNTIQRIVKKLTDS